MKVLCLKKIILGIVVISNLSTFSKAANNDEPNNAVINTARPYRVSCQGQFLNSRLLEIHENIPEQRNDLLFKFIPDRENSYRIGDVNGNVLNVENAFWPWAWTEVYYLRMTGNDGTWLGHRRFQSSQREDGYFQFINTESNSILGVSGTRLIMFRRNNNDTDYETNKLFILTLESPPDPTIPPKREGIIELDFSWLYRWPFKGLLR